MQNTDYKQTINLPKTDFSMKANLPKKEPDILAKWQKEQLYEKILKKSETYPKYILHDGPPYANGNIHIGHALNKILKDIILKYKTLSGFNVPYLPGWDCHGLPVELQLFKELKKRKDEVEQVSFRKKAYDFAMRFVAIQKEEFKRLGVFGDWEHPYLTLSYEYEAAIIRAFGALVEKGYVYRGIKPVNWCCDCETALAEAEVEYAEHTSPSIYVKFPLSNIKEHELLNKYSDNDIFIIIWTTTPWTLLGNVACCVHPDFTYVLLMLDNRQIYIIEQHLSAAVLEKAQISNYRIVGQLRGVELEHLEYAHPFIQRAGKVVLADYVSCDEGSGIVHTAPGYGSEDFLTGKRYNLDLLMQVDNRGYFFENVTDFGGEHVFKANKKIIAKLKEENVLLFSSTIAHSYPHCWRCNKPIIFRATEQWFINIEHNQLRKKLLDVIKTINWVPQFGENRISAMVENRPDWCLSRQRLWGVPIPVFYCASCNRPILDKQIVENFAHIVESEGTDSWFIRKAEDFLPKGFVCFNCKKSDFIKEKDILDVWFDSGVSHQAVVKANKGFQYPADLYLEGSDQHRGWFQAALITAMAIDDSAPFKQVLTHGFTVDGEGKKMSKSRGNVIAPQDVINKLGADVLRLCIASSDYNDDVRMSQEILARVSESYRKIRNTIKFILGNLFDYDPKKDALSYSDLMEIDRWALSKLNSLVKDVTRAYDKFVFHQAVKFVYNFCVVQMSSFYLDVLKDRLYTFAKDSHPRRSAQTVIYEILIVLLRIIAPVLAFTAEEAYGFAPGEKKDSIFLMDWPKFDEKLIDPVLDDTWKFILDLRSCVLKELEQTRVSKLIGNSLEAKVVICYDWNNKAITQLLEKYEDQLMSIFIVSEVKLNSGIDSNAQAVYNVDLFSNNTIIESGKLAIKIDKATGEKCIRCWNYSKSVGKNGQDPKLCNRCLENLQ